MSVAAYDVDMLAAGAALLLLFVRAVQSAIGKRFNAMAGWLTACGLWACASAFAIGFVALSTYCESCHGPPPWLALTIVAVALHCLASVGILIGCWPRRLTARGARASRERGHTSN